LSGERNQLDKEKSTLESCNLRFVVILETREQNTL
jgi:hypothetical protein